MSEYLPIRVSTLRGDQPIQFNAYVRVAGKYILYCREGDSFEGSRLDRLREKKLEKMWVPKEQENLYNSYLTKNMEDAYSSNQDKPLEIRCQIIQGLLQSATEDLIEELDNDANYKILSGAVKRFLELYFAEPKMLGFFLDIKNPHHNVAHHGVNVCALTLSLAQHFGHHESSPMQMVPLSIGCLIHDLDHQYSNISIKKKPSQLEGSEKELYKYHSISGANRIKKIPFYDSLTWEIIAHHEEAIDGSGVASLKEKDMSDLLKLAITANTYERYLSYDQLSHKEALKKILIEKMGICSLESMTGLQEVLKTHKLI